VETTFTSSTASPQFKMGKDLVEMEQIPMLPTRMRQLHSWYKKKKGVMFGVRYLDEGLRKGENIV